MPGIFDLLPASSAYDPAMAPQMGDDWLGSLLHAGLSGLMGQPSWLQQANDLSQRQEAMRQAGASQGQIVQGTLNQAANVAPQFVGAIGDAPPGIRAFHGSPYDFDKFDLSKIGTGEGAQAYGHGLYFAENPGVAESYKPQASPFPDFSTLTDFQGPDQPTIYHVTGPGGVKYGTFDTKEAANKFADEKNTPPPGRMYEVNIAADPEHFLDWDKPLSEQSPQVQAAMNARAKQLGVSTDDVPNDAATAQYLQSQGVPGIKYLDQGSRASGTGTHNYVVFDHNLVDIIKKYGIAGLSLLGAGASQLPIPAQAPPRLAQ